MASKRQICIDMILNIIAVTVPVVILQLVIYPITAEKIGGEEYGLMLTVYSIWIMISNSLGNVLNAIRLLYDHEYKEKNIEGDFMFLCRKWGLINCALICGIIIFYCKEVNLEHIILGIIVSLLIFIKAYTEVGFRIILNYKAIVINNILQSIGFLIGFYITIKFEVWECIFIFGYLMSCVYCILKTKLYKESYRKTELFKCVNKDINNLILATVIGTMMDYADKLILYPLMGGTAVSIYYTATILGRVVGMLTGPINSVILSYISKWKENKKHILTKAIGLGVCLCIIGYIITIFVSKPVIGLLFPQWVNEVMIYLPVTTINVLLLALISMVSPFILKFCDMKWQIMINGISVGMYFICSLTLWNFFGLMGFCIGTIIGSFTKLLIMLILYYNRKDNVESK